MFLVVIIILKVSIACLTYCGGFVFFLRDFLQKKQLKEALFLLTIFLSEMRFLFLNQAIWFAFI
ncbi:MAG: hypothetical protein CMJ31_07125 [Phycisphaerae bacterium]|nr:hypothetical protein [Phycisphaerae bacterium]